MAKAEIKKLLAKLAKTNDQNKKRNIRKQLRDLDYYLSRHKK